MIRPSAPVFCGLLSLVACVPPPTPTPVDGEAHEAEKSDKGDDKKKPELRLSDAKEIDAGSVSAVVEGGGDWDADGNTLLEGPVVIRFEKTQSDAKRFDWSFDRDDVYLVAFLAGNDLVGHREIRVKDNHGTPKGMWRSDYRIPKAARRAGFDAVYIAPIDGNDEYSLGHFQLIEDVKAFKKEREAGRKARRAAKSATAEGTDAVSSEPPASAGETH